MGNASQCRAPNEVGPKGGNLEGKRGGGAGTEGEGGLVRPAPGAMLASLANIGLARSAWLAKSAPVWGRLGPIYRPFSVFCDIQFSTHSVRFLCVVLVDPPLLPVGD